MIVLLNPVRVPGGLADAARERLRAVPYAAVRRISCEHRHGRLVLRGRLPSFYLKQLAQEAVAGLDGVREIVNEVEVERPAERTPRTEDL